MSAKEDIDKLPRSPKDGEYEFDDILEVLEKYEKIAEPLNTKSKMKSTHQTYDIREI